MMNIQIGIWLVNVNTIQMFLHSIIHCDKTNGPPKNLEVQLRKRNRHGATAPHAATDNLPLSVHQHTRSSSQPLRKGTTNWRSTCGWPELKVLVHIGTSTIQGNRV